MIWFVNYSVRSKDVFDGGETGGFVTIAEDGEEVCGGYVVGPACCDDVGLGGEGSLCHRESRDP